MPPDPRRRTTSKRSVPLKWASDRTAAAPAARETCAPPRGRTTAAPLLSRALDHPRTPGGRRPRVWTRPAAALRRGPPAGVDDGLQGHSSAPIFAAASPAVNTRWGRRTAVTYRHVADQKNLHHKDVKVVKMLLGEERQLADQVLTRLSGLKGLNRNAAGPASWASLLWTRRGAARSLDRLVDAASKTQAWPFFMTFTLKLLVA